MKEIVTTQKIIFVSFYILYISLYPPLHLLASSPNLPAMMKVAGIDQFLFLYALVDGGIYSLFMVCCGYCQHCITVEAFVFLPVAEIQNPDQ